MPEKTAFRIEVRCAGVVEKDAPSDLPVYPEVPYAFFGFHPGLLRTFHLLDVRYPQVYRTQPLGASRKLTGVYGRVNSKENRIARQRLVAGHRAFGLVMQGVLKNARS